MSCISSEDASLGDNDNVSKLTNPVQRVRPCLAALLTLLHLPLCTCARQQPMPACLQALATALTWRSSDLLVAGVPPRPPGLCRVLPS